MLILCKILPGLLGADDEERHHQRARICPTIRDMSYIGIFPMASHFSTITMHFPKLDRFYVQIVPRNDILDDPDKVSQVETVDLWMERNSCYALLMSELFNSPPVLNFSQLRVFESGDAADRDAWNMAAEYVKRVNSGWKVAGDGIFERDPEHLSREPPEGEEVGFSMSVPQYLSSSSSIRIMLTNIDRGGSLIRCAFNGTAQIPVSPYPMYDRALGPVN
jgi:hypothetical protein